MSLLNNLTLSQLFTRLAACLVVIAIHGLALAGLARLLGDRTPQYTGRLTLNPLTHLSMPGLVMGTLFQLFWIAPIKVKAENLRWGRFGLVLVGLGALAATLLIVPLLQLARVAILVNLPRSNALATLLVVDQIQNLSLWFVALNWLPLPLLTGSLFACAAMPSLERPFTRQRSLVMVVLIAAIVSGSLEYLLAPIRAALGIFVPG